MRNDYERTVDLTDSQDMNLQLMDFWILLYGKTSKNVLWKHLAADNHYYIYCMITTISVNLDLMSTRDHRNQVVDDYPFWNGHYHVMMDIEENDGGHWKRNNDHLLLKKNRRKQYYRRQICFYLDSALHLHNKQEYNERFTSLHSKAWKGEFLYGIWIFI